MNRVTIDRERCKACGLCIDACPKHIIALGPDLNERGYRPVELHDLDLCTACTLCGVVCSDGSVTVWKGDKPARAA